MLYTVVHLQYVKNEKVSGGKYSNDELRVLLKLPQWKCKCKPNVCDK